MTEEFNASNPIYLQLAGRINRQIIRNELKPGEKLPSVREMAIQSGVNPNTVMRTYNELERMQVVETKRGQGTFVTENHEVLENLRNELKSEIIHQFANSMREMGFSNDEMLIGLKTFLEKKNGSEQL